MPHCPQPCRLPKAALALAVAGLAAAIGCTTEEGRLRSEIEAKVDEHDALFREWVSLAPEGSPRRDRANGLPADAAEALGRELSRDQLLALRELVDMSIRSVSARVELARKERAERDKNLAMVEERLEKRARLYERWRELANLRQPGSGDVADTAAQRARERMATAGGSTPVMLRSLAQRLDNDYGKLRIEVLQLEGELAGTAEDELHGTRAYGEELLVEYAGLFARWRELANRKEPGSGDVENEVDRVRRAQLHERSRWNPQPAKLAVGMLENDILRIRSDIAGLERELGASTQPVP